MYDGFDEDSEILSCLPGLVPFEADAKTRRAGVIEGHLKHELFFPVLWNQAWHMGHLVLLGARERVMKQKGVRRRWRGERGGNSEEKYTKGQLIGLE